MARTDRHETYICDACGADIYYSDVRRWRIGQTEYHLCPGREGPKRACLRRLLENPGTWSCPGCGERRGARPGDGWRVSHCPPGSLCPDCESELAWAARQRAETPATRSVALVPEALFGSLGLGGGWDHKEATRALARALSDPPRRAYREQGGDHKGGVRYPEYPHSSYDHPTVELTSEQEVALAEFVQLLREAVLKGRRRSYAEGQSLLHGLATGQINLEALGAETIARSRRLHGET